MFGQPIVYGARYYRTRGTSHYHLFRCDPDGTGRRQLTSGKSDDTLPVWSPDGKWIAFYRSWQNRSHPDSICVMPADGGLPRPVFTAGTDGRVVSLSAEWLNLTHLLIYSFRDLYPRGQYRFTTHIVEVATGRTVRQIPATWQHDISPDRTHLVAWSDGNGENTPIRIVRLADGKEISLKGDLTGTSIWIDNQRCACLAGPYENPRLILFTADGKLVNVLTIRLDSGGPAWLKQNSGIDSSASFLDRMPGRTDKALVGWQLGGSQDGAQAATFYVDLASGKATPWAITNEIVPSPDARYFLTTQARDLAPLRGGGDEWVSPLLLGKTTAPQNQCPIIEGLVHVAGFDWRPALHRR